MCGRYNVTDDLLLRRLLESLDITDRIESRYNIAPTESVPIIRVRDQDKAQGYELCNMAWWLVPAWVSEPATKYSMFNARAETLAESRAFRHPFKRQRCIFPVSSFIEWTQENGKQPYQIEGEESALAIAGIWDQWGEGEGRILSCAMITTDAAPAFRPIHNRMPVMLPPDMLRQWLDPEIEGKALLHLLTPQLPTALRSTPLHRRINNSRLKAAPEPVGRSEVISDRR